MSQHRQQQCCVLGLCCGRVAQQEALSAELEHEGIGESAKVAAWVLERFDLAPVGTLLPYGEAIMALARGQRQEK